MEDLSAQILTGDTYFGLIAEYLHSIEYLQSMCLTSKYHHNFIKIKQYTSNRQIISRILSREFFEMKRMSHLMKIDMYKFIYILHHFHMDFRVGSNWMKRSFLWRWRYLTKNNEIKMYGLKHWIKSHKKENTNDLAITLIFHSQMNGDANTFKIDSCSELMDWSIKHNGHFPKISELLRLMVSTLNINHRKRQRINHLLFAWCLNYLCAYFERKLIDQRNPIGIVQEFSNLIAEIILILHTANIQNGITTKQQEIKQFELALTKYSIRYRIKRIWSEIVCGNIISLINGFPADVTALFNQLMAL